MQFGHALEQVLWKVVTADPAQGPLYLLKIDLSDSFYHVCLCVQDDPLLGVAFPVAPSELLLTATGVAYGVDGKSSILLHNHRNNSRFS